jgi:hypothetical protein
MKFVIGPCPLNSFRTSPWTPGNCGVADGLGPHCAKAFPEIPIHIPNQYMQILARQSPLMKPLGVQALARVCRGGTSNATTQAKALTPNGLDAVASLPCAEQGRSQGFPRWAKTYLRWPRYYHWAQIETRTSGRDSSALRRFEVLRHGQTRSRDNNYTVCFSSPS